VSSFLLPNGLQEGNSFVPRFFAVLSSDGSPPLAERKSRTGQRICASWSGLNLASLNHIKPRHYRLAMVKPLTRFDVSQQRYSCIGEGYFFFFLPVFFFAFFAFLAILPSGIPKLVEMQVEHLDVQR